MIASLLGLAGLTALAPIEERGIPSMASRPPDEQWIAFGLFDVDTDYDPSDVDGDRAKAFSYGAGAWWWGESFGNGAEAQILYLDHEATVGGVTDDLVTWNVMVGARAGWRGFGDRVVAYGRGGALWRTDNGDGFTAISDDGFGVYGGLGLEVRVGSRFAIAPEMLWTWADVAEESTQTAAGVSLVLRF